MESVLLKCNYEPSGWAIVELQGILVNKYGPLDGEKLGLLDIHDNIPELIIGDHKLMGQIVKLQKPLLVLKKGDPVGDSTTWESHAVIRTKYVFNQKPETVQKFQI